MVYLFYLVFPLTFQILFTVKEESDTIKIVPINRVFRFSM